ncbi:hypothetical protein ACX0G9_10955 [Flavitalea flava]
MKKVFIDFDYKEHSYNAVIRYKQKTGDREFDITVLDWELERLLYDNHLIREIGGSIQADLQLENKEQTELKLIIAAKLSNHLKIPCFAGDHRVIIGSPVERWESLHPISRHINYHPEDI